MPVFTPDQPDRNSITSSDSNAVMKENTKLKMQLFELAKENHKLSEQLNKERSEVASLQQQISAQQIAYQCNAELYEQQMQIYRQNQNECLEQMRINYSPDKGNVIKNLHQRYVEDIELIKRELLAKCKEIYNKELQIISNKQEERYKFQLHTLEQQLARRDAQLNRYKQLIKERDAKWRLKYEHLKRSGRTPAVSPVAIPRPAPAIQSFHGGTSELEVFQDHGSHITALPGIQAHCNAYQTPSDAVRFSGVGGIEMSPQRPYKENIEQLDEGISIPASISGSGGHGAPTHTLDQGNKITQNDFPEHLYGTSIRSFSDDRPAVETDQDIYQQIHDIQAKAQQIKDSINSNSQTSLHSSIYSQPAHVQIPIIPTTQENMRITQLSSMHENTNISQQLDTYKFDIPDELALV